MSMHKSVVPFKDVPVGAAFLVKKAERHGGRPIRGIVYNEEYVVPNTGTYIKRGATYSEDIHTSKDAIFAPNTPCQVIKSKA